MKTYGQIVILCALACYADTNPPSNYSTNSQFIIRASPPTTNFLTIYNRAYVQIEGTVIIRCTDAEWSTITNQYRHAIQTNQLKFYGTNW